MGNRVSEGRRVQSKRGKRREPPASGHPAPGNPPAWSWVSDTGPGRLGGSSSKREAEGRHSQRTCGAGVLQTVGDGEMRFWRLLEAEMRLPGQRGPSRSLLRRPQWLPIANKHIFLTFKIFYKPTPHPMFLD